MHTYTIAVLQRGISVDNIKFGDEVIIKDPFFSARVGTAIDKRPEVMEVHPYKARCVMYYRILLDNPTVRIWISELYIKRLEK